MLQPLKRKDPCYTFQTLHQKEENTTDSNHLGAKGHSMSPVSCNFKRIQSNLKNAFTVEQMVRTIAIHFV